MLRQVFFMVYRNIQAYRYIYVVSVILIICTPLVRANDVFDSLRDDIGLPMSEQILNIIDDELLKKKHLQDTNIATDTPRITVPLGYILHVELDGGNWVLDARRSELSQKNKSAIILQGLEVSRDKSVFSFTRDGSGINKLVFSRNDNATAEEFSYLLFVDWVQDSARVTIDETSMLLHDFYATVTISPQDSIANMDTAVAPIPLVEQNSESFVEVQGLSKELGEEPVPMQIKIKSKSINNYDASLKKINEFLKTGNYAKAQEVIAEHKNSADLKNAIPRFLFDSAQYLETIHEREDMRGIQNIEKAIMFYERIVKEYPLSVLYDDALVRYEFLQKKYLFIR